MDYGIFGYGYPGEPLGGIIKDQLSDFRVIEIDPYTDDPISVPPATINYHFEEGGLFLVGRVWRKGMDHSKMIRLISKSFGVPEDRVSTAGIKDARAEIVQLFSVYQPRRKISDPTLIAPGLEVDSFQYSRSRIYPGSMGGNYFKIAIRDTNTANQEELDNFGEWAEKGMLNYYGYQRFGSSRPITAEFGRYIANRDYKSAIDIYLGGRSAGKDEKYRKHWREYKDPDELLVLWDSVPHIERDILKHLSRRRNDYKGAMSKIPEFLVNISQSAFISYLTNHYLSRRGMNTSPLLGERNIKDNIEVALPSNRWTKPLNSIWEEVFEYLQVDLQKELKPIRHTTRFLLLKVKNWNSEIIDDSSIRVSFQLKPGEYATIVLRQLMQQPPSQLF